MSDLIQGAKGSADFSARVSNHQNLQFHTVTKNTLTFRCYNPDGSLKWEEIIPNLTTTEGRNDALTQYLKGSSYTAAWFVGLIDNAAFSAIAVTDVAAQIGGTNGWTELTAYSQATRPALTLGTASAGSIDNSGSVATFSINATKTIYGGFTISNFTKAGTTGKIYGEGAFSSPRSMANGDTLTVTVTLTLASA